MFSFLKRNAPNVPTVRAAPGAVNLMFVLKDEALYEAFHAFCVMEMTQENLHFLDLVLRNNYQRNLTIINENFIVMGSPQMLNISWDLRDDLLNAIAALRRKGENQNKAINYSKLLRRLENAMEPVINDVVAMLQFGALIRFKQTPEFRAAFAKRRRRRGVIRL